MLENQITLTGPQSNFFQSENKFPLFVGGFGSGKSKCMCISALNDLFSFPGANIAVYAPTYDLLKLVIMEYLDETLTAGGFGFSLNKVEHVFAVKGAGKIICRSMDSPARIIGYETFRAHVDELDTLEEKKARQAWNKIIARNRQKVFKRNKAGKKIPLLDENGEFILKGSEQQFELELNRVSAYTTPEGFGFAYQRWVKEADEKGDYAVFRAPTRSNPHLPDDYIDTLLNTYPLELAQAYIEGEFTNLKSGRVYRKFDRFLNGTDAVVNGRETLLVGMDFNIEKGFAAIHVMRDGNLHAVDEIHNSYDTDDTIRILDERYPENPIEVYPDATGQKRSSATGAPSQTDISKLKNANFLVVVDYSNPRIKDRVNCVNAQICNGKAERNYFVNADMCPNIVESLEKQVWDDNGLPDKSMDFDHATDAIGYLIVKKFPIRRASVGYGVSMVSRGQ